VTTGWLARPPVLSPELDAARAALKAMLAEKERALDDEQRSVIQLLP